MAIPKTLWTNVRYIAVLANARVQEANQKSLQLQTDDLDDPNQPKPKKREAPKKGSPKKKIQLGSMSIQTYWLWGPFMQ